MIEYYSNILECSKINLSILNIYFFFFVMRDYLNRLVFLYIIDYYVGVLIDSS